MKGPLKPAGVGGNTKKKGNSEEKHMSWFGNEFSKGSVGALLSEE